MDPSALINRIFAHGADKAGILDRFSGDDALYVSCFLDFMEEPNVAALENAVAKQDYEQAFSYAHALKGLSGNLGLTAYYQAIYRLVESLRAGRYENAGAEYAVVRREFDCLTALLSDEPPAPAAAQAKAEKKEEDAASSQKGRRDRFITGVIAGLFAVLICVGYVFCIVFMNYQDKISQESAEHLIEISAQLRLYVEERIRNDWNVARSVGDSIVDSNYIDDDEAIFQMMLRKKAVWQVTDIMLYTENGYSICADGAVAANDVASNAVDQARRQGQDMSIVDSEIIYTVPVTTELRYNGSRIAAVSVVQSMGSFLDNMGFSSFDGNAWMYLTESSGVVISRLSNERAIPAFNFMAVAEACRVTALKDGLSGDDLLTVPEPTAFIMAGGGGSNYVVSTPVSTSGAPLRLFYLAPKSVVNATMNGFSRQLVVLSLVVIAVFGVFAVLLFLSVYRVRKKQFDAALLARERMFDLLIQNTKTAFGLFRVNAAEPVYVSSNAESVIDDVYFTVDKTGDRFFVRNSAGTETDAIQTINERMRGWDGTSEFKSGYILSDQSAPPNYFELLLYPVGGEGEDFVGIAQDVTQAYERETAVRSALAMAERANAAKSRFLSNMSHDIRTPMNAIVNMTGFALENLGSPKQMKEYLQTIRESSDHLLHLINDVLDMSRIESGQTVVASEAFDILTEMNRQAMIIRPLCNAKGQTLIADFSEVRATAVLGDRMKFSQIVANLLSNAVKFTPEKGAVRFIAKELPSISDEMVTLHITVEDNGIGVSPDYLAHIFEPFSRADDRRVGRIEGTGLGLSICHSYVTAMGGTITCQSEENEGSIFTVELFFQKADGSYMDGAEPELRGEMPFLGMRCLVAEDNHANQIIAKTMLERLGFVVDVASDGWETLQRFLQSTPGFFDVIYLDIQMPVMDGYQTAVAIRESTHAQAESIPIIAMTANVFAEDIEKARIAGMDGHLGKPIMLLSLIDETGRAIEKRGGVNK